MLLEEFLNYEAHLGMSDYINRFYMIATVLFFPKLTKIRMVTSMHHSSVFQRDVHT
ncbi:hypothetical protein ANCCAN_12920 [Ancylostoma caninum]|uniref:Uncharacterized protein n=1 Tax=Ancylostoma caninum TaxID=29170 RepID=A0A368GCX4_ANCCA|nr:hypothetical protein ANCCAN_12920 [Ancylostoma caninum]